MSTADEGVLVRDQGQNQWTARGYSLVPKTDELIPTER